MTKLIRRVKDYSYRERLEELGLITLLERRMRGYLIENFKIINVISNYDRHFFNISPQSGNLMSRSNVMARGFRFMPLSLVRLRTFQLSTWVS